MNIFYGAKNLFSCSFLKLITITILVSQIISLFMFIFPDKDNTFILITLIVILLMSYLMINLIDVTDSEIKKKI